MSRRPAARGPARIAAWPRSAPWAAAVTWSLLASACAPAHDPETLYRDLQSNDLEVRQEASDTVDALIREGDYRVFLRGLESPNPIYRAESIVYLARLPQPEARRNLIDLLRIEKRMMLPYNPIRLKPSSTPSDSRILVAHMIKTFGKDPGAVPALLAGMERDQPDDVIIGTCFALGALEDPAGVSYLVQASQNRNVEIARAAVQSLARLQGADALKALADLARHPVMEVRGDVVSALSLRNEDLAIEALKSMGASDASPDVRAAAIRGLMQSGRPALTPYLIERLRAGDETTRAAAVEVLQKLTGRSFGARADLWSKWWTESQARPAAPR